MPVEEFMEYKEETEKPDDTQAAWQQVVTENITEHQPMPSVCKSCPNEHKCRDVWAVPRQGPFSAGGLALASIAAFILPVFFAITVTALVKVYYVKSQNVLHLQLLAAVAGLLIGTGVAWLIMPLIRRYFSE